MLAEFKYELVPKESFANYLGDQTKRRRFVLCRSHLHHCIEPAKSLRLFYHFKKVRNTIGAVAPKIGPDLLSVPFLGPFSLGLLESYGESFETIRTELSECLMLRRTPQVVGKWFGPSGPFRPKFV
jgi:hypothetical protein